MTSDMICYIRHKNKLTLEQLGDRLGVSSRTVWNWEAGRTRPGPHHTIILEKLFEMGQRIAQDQLENGRKFNLPNTCTIFIAALGHEPERDTP